MGILKFLRDGIYDRKLKNIYLIFICCRIYWQVPNSRYYLIRIKINSSTWDGN